MVGVPGKSKGCNTCRKRKIACSLERPECLKCVRTNRVCGGYQRDAIFVVDQATGDSTPDSASKSHVKTYRRSIITPKQPLDVLDAARKSRSSSTSGSGSGSLNTDASASSYISDIEITSPAAFRRQFFCQFLSSFSPDSDQAAVRLKVRSEENTWLVLIPELPDLTKALDTAILALSTASLGRSKNDKNLIIESRRMYVEGLRDLQRALWDPKLMYRDETLAACMALGLYETLECPGGSRGGWVGHSDGCARLVQLRGPKAHSESLGHHLFLSFRLTGIVQGIHHRQATYLSEPAWTKIAFQGRSSGSLDQLLDIMSHLPSIFEASDLLGNPRASDMPAIFAVLDRCWQMDASLQKFYEDLKNTSDGPLYWNRLSTLELIPEEVDAEKLFPVAFHFNDLSTAFATNMYWLTCILCWRTIMEIYGRVMRCGHSPIKTEDATPQIPYMARLRPLEHRKDLVGVAKNICQAFEFCVQEDKRSKGPGAVIVPMLMATLTFRYSPGCERELMWARAAMAILAERGWRISTHLEPEGSGYTKKKPNE